MRRAPRPVSNFYSPTRDAARTRRQFLMVALGLLAAAAACMLWPTAIFWRQSRLAAGLAEYAERSPEGAARLAVRHVAECGLAGVDSLVRLAGSPQVAAATAAREALLNELAGWEMEYRVGGDRELLARRLGVLTDSLAGRAGRFDLEARHWAGEIAQQVVAHGDEVEAGASMELLQSCETVLAMAPPESRRKDLTAPAPTAEVETGLAATGPPSPAPAAALPVEPPATKSPLAAAEPLRVAQAPTGDLNLVPSAPPQPLLTTPIFPAPRDLSQAPADSDFNPLRGPGAPTTPTLPNMAEARPLPAPPMSDEVVDIPSPAESRHLMRRYRQLSDTELAALIDTGSPYEALAVRQVLRERGKAESSTTAQRPGSVTDASREKILETISRLPAGEGRAMLRRLVVDADAEVRLQALTILATTDDPQLATIVRRRAVEDSDPRVTELASRILKARK